MTTIADVSRFLESFAPPRLAENWDNVGLLAGDRTASVQRIMTCLTITPDSAAEAVRERADLIVSHHPLPFKPLGRLTTDQTPARLLWQLIGARVAIYSPHTAFDSAATGINQRLAEGLGLTDIRPLTPLPNDPQGLGSGRVGCLPTRQTLHELAARVMSFLGVEGLHRVGASDRAVERVAVGCGSAGSFLATAHQAGCEVLVTGETNFHTCLEAEALGIGLLLPGHYASERFGVEALATELARQFPALTVWPSRAERDPLVWIRTPGERGA